MSAPSKFQVLPNVANVRGVFRHLYDSEGPFITKDRKPDIAGARKWAEERDLPEAIFVLANYTLYYLKKGVPHVEPDTGAVIKPKPGDTGDIENFIVD